MDTNELRDKLNKIEETSKRLDKQTRKVSLDLHWNHPDYNAFQGTYLESKESIIELYKLFIFYGMLEACCSSKGLFFE